jgi:signal transduction histidine kinase
MSPPSDTSSWQTIAALAGSLAHEIKNPLGIITLNLQLLQEDWADADTPRERRTLRKLQILQRETERLKQILEDFLRYARTDELQLEATDVNALCGEIAEFVEPELDRSDIRLLEQYATGLPRCQADRRLLKQAVLNPILNAQQAMPEGGELILRTSRGDGTVCIEIIDTGPGIPEHLRDKVFELFFSTKGGGTGIGLATTRRIVEQHGGAVRLHSESDRGTDLVIALPVETDAANETQPPE